ncbi:exocyst complex component 7-like [Uloborus diversus]|uniref:exocyst complex component 7-like n=1 Tax=Uloborus diversus TaxID=327109 RepID=UPI002409D977|nr:exocyst complex component 7-like [Uloborus diversus]
MEDPGLKLEKETRSLALLREKIDKSCSLGNAMCSILTSFDEHLMKLEQTILPVYLETGNLQRRQENIEKILDRLDYVIQYYKVPKEVEGAIRDGPSGCLESYLECLKKVQSSMTFFSENNQGCSELEELTALFDQGVDSLQIEFRNLLSRYSKPIPAVTVLDMLGMDEEMQPDEEKLAAEQLPDSVLQDLIKISSWLQAHGIKDFVSVYSSIRSGVLTRSIQNLKDHLKNASGNSNTLSIQNSPQMGSRRSIAKESTPRRPPKNIQQMFVRKATAVIAKYSPTVESAMLGHRFQSSLLPEPKDEIPETDIMAFMTSVSGLLKLMQSELNLMRGIIPGKSRKVVFECVVTQAMGNLVSEGELIVNRVKKSVSRHEFSAALNLFPILRHLKTIESDFERLFQGCSSKLFDKVREFEIKVEVTISKTLEEFIESIKNDTDPKMPKDGTVHQLTSSAIMLLEQLLDYQDILGTVLRLQDTSFATTKDKGKLAFAQYITRVLSALGLTLQNKSEYYSDVYLRAIFRMNNLHYIVRALQRTGLLEIVQLHNPGAENNYMDQIREQKRVYSQSWSRVLHYVMEVDKPISQQRASLNTAQVPVSMKLRDKDKQNIKDKFTGFNKEIEEITKTQKAYAVPDIELRESLKRDNKEFILPKYTMFYEKYIEAGFTKNIEKYIKHKPQDISDTIDTFFDAAA